MSSSVLQLGGHVGEVGNPQLQALNLLADTLHVGTFLRQDDLVRLAASLPHRHQHLIEDLLVGTRHSSCGVLSREERRWRKEERRGKTRRQLKEGSSDQRSGFRRRIVNRLHC